ncbi:MAG: long-chain fatty acid--CoA ligase [Pseudomonadota bacterium]
MDMKRLLEERATAYPDKAFLIGEFGSISYAEFDQASDRLANNLLGLGVRPGDRVAILHPNSSQLFLAYYAIVKIGAVVVPINPVYTPREIVFILNDSGATVLLAHESLSANAQVAADQAPALKTVLTRSANQTMEDALAMSASNGTSLAALPELTPDTPAFTFYTSGTTGRPKGVVLTHRNLCFGGPNIAQSFGLRESDVAMVVLPMVHIFCIASPFMGSLSAGGSVVVLESFKTEIVLEAFSRHGVTWFPGVPTMFTYLLSGVDSERHDVSSLRMGLSGGASLPVEVLRQWEERFGARVIEAYGLTESTGLVACSPVYGERKPGSIGISAAGVEVRLVDERGLEVPVGQVGHLVFQGPNGTPGYHRLPELTAEKIKDGWIYTGDHAYRDADGHFFIVGREAELIITGGYNVYPREIEEVLYAMDGVGEAAVIGVPHPVKGEVPKAFVSLKPGSEIGAEDILEHCRHSLAPYKLPQIEFMPDLPKNPTGKIMKKELPKQ